MLIYPIKCRLNASKQHSTAQSHVKPSSTQYSRKNPIDMPALVNCCVKRLALAKPVLS